MTPARLGRGAAVAVGLALAPSSCEPIEPRPLSDAPMNRCPCEAFDEGRAGARCTVRDRCEIQTAGGRPEFPFWVVVQVPDTSSYAPGLTYVFFSDAQGNPAFKEPPSRPGVVIRCRPPGCLPLGGVTATSGGYKVAHAASVAAGTPLPDGTSIPVRVVYERLGNLDPEVSSFPSLPLDVLFGSSRVVEFDGRRDVEFSRVVPAGRYARVFYPQPPFDEIFPPHTARAQEIPSGSFVDFFTLGVDGQLDDVSGDTRVAVVKRQEGLDGWRVWLVDRPSQRRISVVRTLEGTEATVRLDTTGEQRAPGGGLGDDVEAVLSPPESWTAVPRLVTRLFGGAGLKNLSYPTLPAPVPVSGVVAQPGEEKILLGYPARVTFESQDMATAAESSTLLRYSTTLSTDNRGLFATVLPPGTYAATVEPAEGTGYAKRTEIVVVPRAVSTFAFTFQPPPRTVVKGRALLTDGRPLREAEVVAVPNAERAGTSLLVPRPRPGRTRTDDDGRFSFALDPGPYVLSVIPKAGTGFPRVVVRPDVPGSSTPQETELPDVRVPPPSRLAFTLRAPSRPQNPIENPIENAVVRVFATPAAGGGAQAAPVEIGRAMTDSSGAVEILLAQEPR